MGNPKPPFPKAAMFKGDRAVTARGIVVFPLPSWAQDRRLPWKERNWARDEFLECVEEEHEPVFSRHGLYIDKQQKICWIESPFGCFSYPNGYETYLFKLEMDLWRPLSARAKAALRALALERAATKDNLRTLEIDDTWWYVHEQRLHGLRVKQRLKAFKKEHGIT